MRGFAKQVFRSSIKSGHGIESVPRHFLPQQNFRYPSDNAHPFERWYYDSYTTSDARERIYLPIQWTAIYCNGKFGKDKHVIAGLQAYLHTLDTKKSYYTIVQFDDGILNDISHLDIKVFGMSGGRVDFPIPLLCMPHTKKVEPATRWASFVGKLTHPIRTKMVERLSGEQGYYISTDHHNIDQYCKVLSSSLFALAPRGYGPTSFRIQEAIDVGTYPVYISDHHIIPYNRPFNYGVLLHPQDDVISALQKADTKELLYNRKQIDHLFTYKGCKEAILKELKS